MSIKNFARMLGVQEKQGVTPAQKRDRGLDLATAKPGFARILKKETPKTINHSPLAWQVRARGLVG
jgi:hypothetical protein